MLVYVEDWGASVVPAAREVGEGSSETHFSTGGIVQMTSPRTHPDLIRVTSVVCTAPVWLWAGRVPLWPLNSTTREHAFIVPHHTDLYLVPAYPHPATVTAVFETINLDEPLPPNLRQRWFGGRLGQDACENLFEDPRRLARVMEAFAPNYCVSRWSAPLLAFLCERRLLDEGLLVKMNPHLRNGSRGALHAVGPEWGAIPPVMSRRRPALREAANIMSAIH